QVRYADFDTRSFSRSLKTPTALDPIVLDIVDQLIPCARSRCDPVRLIGISLSRLRMNQHQLPLFGNEQDDKWERVLRCADAVRRKHGELAIRSAGTPWRDARPLDLQ